MHSYSNGVLYDEKKRQYFLPAYLRLVFKGVSGIDLQQTCAFLSTTLIISIYYKGLPEQHHKLFDDMQIMISDQQSLKLNSQNCKKTIKEKENLMTFNYRGKLPLKLSCNDIYRTPFQTLDLTLALCVRSLISDETNTKLKFNLMDFDDFDTKLSVQTQGDNGQYGLATNKFQIKFSNVREKSIRQKQVAQKKINSQRILSDMTIIDSKKKKTKQRNWQYATYRIKMYRYPISAILTIFIPLWVIAFLNLSVFFASSDLSGRLQSIGGFMIAFTAFLPSIRQKLPPTSMVTFTDVCVYIQIFTTLMTAIQSILVYTSQNPNYIFVWNQDPIFLLCIIVDIISASAVIIMSCLYKFIWQPSYVNNEHNFDRYFEDFDREKWFNNECDDYFQNQNKIVRLGQSQSQLKQE